MYLRIAVLVLVLALCASGCSRSAGLPQSADMGGRTRHWLVHTPPDYRASRALPLVVVFHGYGGTPAGMTSLTGMDRVADAVGFIVVYPEGVDRSWASQTNTEADRVGVDDVAFVAALLDRLEKAYAIDTRHVVLAGFSNGAHLVQVLGCRLADRVSAIVPVSGALAPEAAAECHPSRPLSVVEFHGTADPIDPFAGGRIVIRDGGEVLGATQTIADWARWNGCQDATPPQPVETDTASTLSIRDFPGCHDGVHVRLYQIAGGGHTWPGGPQYLPARYIGAATHVVDASEVIGKIATGKF